MVLYLKRIKTRRQPAKKKPGEEKEVIEFTEDCMKGKRDINACSYFYCME